MSTTIHAGTIGDLTDREFVEGTPEQIREAKARRQKQIIIAAARKRSEWREFTLDSLIAEGRYLLFEDDNLVLEALRVPVWPGGNHFDAMNEHLVHGYFLNDEGDLVFVGRPENGPRTISELRLHQKIALQRRKGEELERRTELLLTPLKPVTLAEQWGVESLPTLRQAADVVLESGKLELVGDRLRVHLRVRGDRELVAARALYASEPLVVQAIHAAGKGKKIALPDVPVLAGGGVA